MTPFKKAAIGGTIALLMLGAYAVGSAPEPADAREVGSIPKPSATAEPTPRPTPVPTPVVTPEPVVDVLGDATAELAFMDHMVSSLEDGMVLYETFNATPVDSDAEWDAALDLYSFWMSEQSWVSLNAPAPCYADLWNAWSTFVDGEYQTWDVATDELIAGSMDYLAAGDTTGIDTFNAFLDARPLAGCI